MSYYSTSELSTILDNVLTLKESLCEETDLFNDELNQVAERNKPSARNLLHYRAVRRKDLTHLQNALGYIGISRLARAQRHIMGSIEAIEYLLGNLQNDKGVVLPNPELSIESGIDLLNKNTAHLLGPASSNRRVRIMVTLPSEAADSYEMVKQMALNGANCMRINCAHDSEVEWKSMIDHVRRAEKELGVGIKVAMDLGGPKIRTSGITKSIKVRKGDVITVNKTTSDRNTSVGDIHIACSNYRVFDAVKPGETIQFDDGKISGVIEDCKQNHFTVKVTAAGGKAKKLKKDKGINLPDTALYLDGLTDQDRSDLSFVAKHADIVNMSFVNTPKDVKLLLAELDQYNVKGKLGLVLKIETKKAFVNLTEILLYAMRWYPFGVMIARGDLAVETGWANMARLQTEILNICGSAHAPVIWATQVLESLAKKGVPSRSEITDAATSLKAECVMLNKGPYITEAIHFLDYVLKDMKIYQSKSSALSPKLAFESNLI
ncbi:MAG: pyruvate kinase [Bacteroidota bacterium]